MSGQSYCNMQSYQFWNGSYDGPSAQGAAID